MISVIVPVYNCKEYLRECVDSILNQTYTAFELILVDDGASDGSDEICDEYAREDSRVCVIHKQNEGAAYARRDGLRAAKSDYVCFVDSDDWIEKHMLETLVDNLNTYNPDIISFGMISGEVILKDKLTPGLYDEHKWPDFRDKGLFLPEINDGGIVGSPCTKLYKKDLLFPYMEQLKEGLRTWEDINYAYAPLFDASSILILDEILYHYRVNENSVSKAINWNELQGTLYSLDGAEKVYKNQSEEMLEAFYSYALRIIWGCFDLFISRAMASGEIEKLRMLAQEIKENDFCRRATENIVNYNIPRFELDFFTAVKTMDADNFVSCQVKKKRWQNFYIMVRLLPGKIIRKIKKR